jgi:hypothetical protein
MPGTFNGGTYEIYWYKGQSGDTPLAPTSPDNQIGVSPTNKTSIIKKGALIALGLTVAKRTIDTVRSEIGATTGNEILQTNINNAMKGLGYISTIAIGGVAGAAMVGVDTTLSAIVFNRELRRTNIAAKYDRDMQGKRANIASGGAYYD